MDTKPNKFLHPITRRWIKLNGSAHRKYLASLKTDNAIIDTDLKEKLARISVDAIEHKSLNNVSSMSDAELDTLLKKLLIKKLTYIKNPARSKNKRKKTKKITYTSSGSDTDSSD